ncbi:MAG: family 78 glycoside hydrolase catalytic domain [Oscillospiraceae bacterium]|nr:family 78 glycoside hydrolase catalytic domain [Oscillospiraceae bacterium]
MKALSNRMPAVWRAKWIDPELPHDRDARQPASVLRRRFTAEHTENATLYLTCHGLYAARLNGRRVGDFVLAPGTGNYHKRLCVQAYDVSDLLHAGENELTVTLGDGWYRGSVGIDGLRNYYGTDLALLCQLEIGGEAVLVSDERWEASQSGPVRENDLQQGERYDARMEQIEDWHGVTVRDYGYANLAPTESVPIIEQERFAGKRITTPNGETVIDFGQNLAGYTELRVTAKAGQTITLWHGETLDENGNFTQSNFDPGERNKNGGIPQKLEYICKDGENAWKPSFTIFGFRYAKIETDVDLQDAAFTAVAVYSEMEQTGFFSCGNDDVNRLFLNSLWSMRSNFCDIPTDCPTRERAGWTGDAGVFAPTAVYLMDCYPVLRKWLGECRLAQHEDGLVENIAPVNNSGGKISAMLQGSAGWGDACVLVPWALYQAYGKTEILEENYDMMGRWLGFVGRRAQKTRIQNLCNPYKKYLVDEGFHFGEWCQPDINNADAMKKTMMFGAAEVATAYYYRSASLMARIAEILGKSADAKQYAEIAENAKKAYRYACARDGVIRSDRQCEYVRPIAFGLLDGDEARTAADTLNDMVVKNGYHLNTGFLSTPDLCRVLADNGHADTAYRLLLQEDCPGWLYAVKQGATTIWETWDGVRADGTAHDSLNHYSYGAISGWLFSGVCGIRLEAGKLTVAPQPGRSLGHARAEWRSPVGTIVSAWAYESDHLTFDITLPVQATICLPDGTTYQTDAGEHHYELLL